MINAEGLVSSPPDGWDLALELVGAKTRCSKRPEASAIGYRRNQRRWGRSPHAAQNNRMCDAEKLADASVNHGAS